MNGRMPTKPTLKRYTWSRLHDEVLRNELWALVAQRTGVLLPIVEAFVARLEMAANQGHPRGDVSHFNVEALAAHWRVPAEDLAKVYAGLEADDVAWIIEDTIVSFWERHPDAEDPTAAERAKRYRARLKVKRRALREGRSTFEALEQAGLSTGPVTRDAVTVTPRAEHIRKATEEEKQENQGAIASSESDVTRGVVHNQSGDFENPGDAEVWLAFHGKRIVTERLQEGPLLALQRIDRWRKSLADDPVVLARIIIKVAASDLVVARFLAAISDAIARHRHEQHGPPLPLQPVLTGRKSSFG